MLVNLSEASLLLFLPPPASNDNRSSCAPNTPHPAGPASAARPWVVLSPMTDGKRGDAGYGDPTAMADVLTWSSSPSATVHCWRSSSTPARTSLAGSVRPMRAHLAKGGRQRDSHLRDMTFACTAAQQRRAAILGRTANGRAESPLRDEPLSESPGCCSSRMHRLVTRI